MKPILVEVKWATSAGDYLPFTALPKSFHGKTVKLEIATKEELAEALAALDECASADETGLADDDGLPPW